jgi:hypothetical protein
VSSETVQSVVVLKDRLRSKLYAEQSVVAFNLVALDAMIRGLDE